MNLARTLPARLGRKWVAAALAAFACGPLSAADLAPAPAPYNADPGVSGLPASGGCQTCNGGSIGHAGHFHGHGKKMTVPYLCPGACFGYFQTKWSRWEDVCNHYYQGVGASDAPRPPVAPLAQPVGPTGTAPMPIPKGALPTPMPLPTPPATAPVAPPTPAPIAPPVGPSVPPVAPR